MSALSNLITVLGTGYVVEALTLARDALVNVLDTFGPTGRRAVWADARVAQSIMLAQIDDPAREFVELLDLIIAEVCSTNFRICSPVHAFISGLMPVGGSAASQGLRWM